MSTTVTTKPADVPVFPAEAVADCLKQELIEAVRAEGERNEEDLPENPDELAAYSRFVDSLSVVEILCVLDDVLPFTVDESVVRAGGYDSIDAAVKHVMGRVEKKWIEHYGEGLQE